jgi:hypothetical protein
VPPVGFVYNFLTKRLERRAILTRSNKKSEQYWERQALPSWYKDKEKEEERLQLKDKHYVDTKLEQYRAQEWDRRINGCWFMNNGVATYITGMHYMYIQWWRIDIGYPKYRITDSDYFYFLQYCIEDPICLGMIEVTKRRFGKTYRGGLFVYDFPSYHEQARSGIQSKTGTDGKKVFSKSVISPFKKLPKFFRPEYDQSQGLTPKKELLFQSTNKKGKRSEEALDVEELESGIDWGTSEEMYYDGQKLYRYLRDEAGKTIEVNVADAHEVIRYCLLDDEGRIIGKALYTTTVEEMEKGGGNFKTLVKNSNHLEVTVDGKLQKRAKTQSTPSGLYTFFMSAKRTRHFDKYGFPDEKRTLEEIMKERALVAHDPRMLSARIRKEPLTIEEAFRIDGNDCHFNAQKLNNQRDDCVWRTEDLYERGNFVWKDGKRDGKVVWEKNPFGRWRMLRGFNLKAEEANAVIKRGANSFHPANAHRFGMACDPYDHDVTEDNRRSNGASLVKQKNNPHNFSDPFINAYVCMYLDRPLTAEDFYEDMIKQCFYFSTPILVENNKPGIIKYFRTRGYTAFLTKLKGYKEVGIPSTPENKSMAMDLVESYVEDFAQLIYFVELLEDLLSFNVKKTQLYDITMAMLWTEVACMNTFRIAVSGKRDVADYFKMKKIVSLS